jgi:hypothetical protein
LFLELNYTLPILLPLFYQKIAQLVRNGTFFRPFSTLPYLALMRFAMVGLSAKKTLLPQLSHFIPIFLISNSALFLHMTHL